MIEIFYEQFNFYSTMKNKLKYSLATASLSAVILSGYNYIHNNEEQQVMAMPSEFEEWWNNVHQAGLVHPDDINIETAAQSLILNKDKNAKVSVESLTPDATVDPNNNRACLLKKGEYYKGDFMRATYTNLSHAWVINNDGSQTRVAKITITFSDSSAKDKDSRVRISVYNDPTRGWWYRGTSSVTAEMRFYDQSGKQLQIQDANVVVGSLNSGDGRTEAAQLLSSGKASNMPGTSVSAHSGNRLYADKDNSFSWSNWDGDSNFINNTMTGEKTRSMIDGKNISADQANAEIQRIRKYLGNDVFNNFCGWDSDYYQETHDKQMFGCGIFTNVTGDSIKLRSYLQKGQADVWFIWSTQLPLNENPTNVSQKKLITKTIHYVYGSGPKKGQTAAPDNRQNVIFWNKGHWNNESEKIIWDNPSSWTNPQKFNDVTCPNI